LFAHSAPGERPARVAGRGNSLGPSIRLIVARGQEDSSRIDALVRLLYARFPGVTVADAPGEPAVDVAVFDLGPEAQLDLANRWMPYFVPRGKTYHPAAVFIGHGCELGARALDLPGRLAEPSLPLESKFRRVLRRKGPESERVLSELSPASLGGAIPPLAADLAGVPELEIEAFGRDAEGRDVALAWHQGRIAFFVPAGPPDALPADWQQLLLDSVSLAAAFGRYEGDPLVARGASPTGEQRAHDSLDALVAKLAGPDPEQRLVARRELEERTHSSPWGWRSGVPRPGASHAAWVSFLKEHGDELVFSSYDGSWHMDWQARNLGVAAADLAPLDHATLGVPKTRAVGESLEAAEALADAFASAGSPWERVEALNRLAPAVSAGDLVAAASEGTPSWVPLFAQAVARRGASGLAALEQLATQPRPFAEELASRMVPSSPLVWILPGELAPAFRQIAWGSDADAALFEHWAHELGQRLALLGEEQERTATERSNETARAFELLGALEVGRLRGLLSQKALDELEGLARERGAGLVAPLGSELLGLFRGVRDPVGLELTRADWRAWRERPDDDPLDFYPGRTPADFGLEGVEWALEELPRCSKSARGSLRYGITLWLAREPDRLAAVSPRVLGLVKDPKALEALLEGDADVDADADALLWQRREAAFTLGSPYVDARPSRDALLAALDDSDPWLRVFACSALREPRGVADEPVRAALEAFASGTDASLRLLAKDALTHRFQPLGWRIRAVLERPDAKLDSDAEARDAASLWAQLERWTGAADSAREEGRDAAWQLAAREGHALLDGLAQGDPLATERVARIEFELGDWIAELCEIMDEESWGGPATTQLGRLGAVALPELENELMRPYRFPIGTGTYSELAMALGASGPDTWPAYLASVHHWRGHGFSDVWYARGRMNKIAFDAIDLAGREALLAPFFAMRFVRDTLLVPMAQDFTVASDGRPWEALVGLWRLLGQPGRDALDELGQHPDPLVRRASAQLSECL